MKSEVLLCSPQKSTYEKKVRLSELCFLIVGAHGGSSVTYRDPAVTLHVTAFESLPQSIALLVGFILIRRKKSPLKRTLFSNRWCPRRDSNPHTLRHMDLNHARLPIPPRGLKEGEII